MASIEEQFNKLKENIEFTVASLINKITEQTQIIDGNKEEYVNDRYNLHLESRVGKLEGKFSQRMNLLF